jgi:anti-sigma factor RsiW
MDCRDLDSLLPAYLDGELLAEDRGGLEGHLAGCSPCGRKAEVARHNHASLRNAARSSPALAPQALRERVARALRAERTRLARRRALRYSTAAAGLLMMLGLAQQQWRAHQRRLHLEDAAQRHARNYPLEIQQPSNQKLEAWFGGKLDHRVTVPHFANATATGARLLNVREKPAAYIRYDATPSGQLGLFVFGDQARDLDLGTRPEASVMTTLGYNVVSWRDGDVVYELVTDLDEHDIRELLPTQVPDTAHLAPPSRLDLKPASFER